MNEAKMFDAACQDLRKAIKSVAVEVGNLHIASAFKIEELYSGQHDEMHANITLAFRHMEDAAMRLGKAIQAYDQGKSIYDK